MHISYTQTNSKRCAIERRSVMLGEVLASGVEGRSDGGVYRYIIGLPPKSVTVLFTCGTLTHVLKLQ